MKKNRYHSLFIYAIIFCVFGYGITRIYGMAEYPDEFGYWSSAAAILGWDWTEMTGLGNYYSFGYSLFLLPALKIARDSVTAYRMAIAGNMLLVCIGFFMLQKVRKKLFSKMEEVKSIYICGMAVLYPSWIFYMQMTMTEAMLAFLFVVIVYVFICFIREPKVITGCLLAVIMIYIYTVHMRTLGVLIAGGITLVLWAFRNPAVRKKIFVFAGILLFALIAAFLLKEIVQQSVYSNSTEELLNVNDYGGHLHKLKELFTLNGIWHFVRNFIGKVLYLGIASFGLFYIAMGWCIGQTISLIRNILKVERTGTAVDIQSNCFVSEQESGCTGKEESKPWLGVFLLLAALGQISICVIFALYNTSMDFLIYGRYNEFIIPVMMVVGLCVLIQSEHVWKNIVVCGAIHSIAVLFCILTTMEKKTAYIRGNHSVGTSCLVGDGNIEVLPFWGQLWLLGIAYFLLTGVIAWLNKEGKQRLWIFAMIFALEIFLCIRASYPYIYGASEVMRQELIIADIITENVSSEEEILFINGDIPQWIDFIQMQLRERPVRLVTKEELDKKGIEHTALITCKDISYKEELEDKYDRCVESGFYYLFYNK